MHANFSLELICVAAVIEEDICSYDYKKIEATGGSHRWLFFVDFVDVIALNLIVLCVCFRQAAFRLGQLILDLI